jgi:hypothetical protein
LLIPRCLSCIIVLMWVWITISGPYKFQALEPNLQIESYWNLKQK